MRLAAILIAATLVIPAAAARAQTPANAPANATGICKDGTFSTAATREGACRGHKGVQTWYQPPAPALAPPTPAASNPTLPPPAKTSAPAPALATPAPAATSPAIAPAPRPDIKAERTKLMAAPPAPGGGPGLVWLNGTSKVYHCPGSDFYGRTKSGSYLPEADAKAQGAHPNRNKPCTAKP